jgi:predicted kinase
MKRPFLILISGYSGTGKTSFSKLLNESLNASLISVDGMEKQLLKLNSSQADKQKYPVSLKMAEEFLDSGQNVIMDGNFRFSRTRIKASSIADYRNIDYFLLRLDCSELLAMKRIDLRHRQYPHYFKKTASYVYGKSNSDPYLENHFLALETNISHEYNVQKTLAYINN